jgi:hypothetical protein
MPERAAQFGNTNFRRETVANAGKHMGPGTQGKHSGTGALTELPEGMLEENMVLSNRDKSRHSDERGLDSAMVQTEQYHDHARNHRNFKTGDAASAKESGGKE